MIKTARISKCGAYRYRLTRYWGPGPMLPVCMLNPSTADAEFDDPTIRRCIGFAKRENCGGIVVGNLYALRATKPGAVKKCVDPYGPENEDVMYELACTAVANDLPVLCAWGAHGSIRGGDRKAVDAFRREGARMVCLGKTAAGHPRHPLYVRADQPFEPLASPSSTQGDG